MSRIDVDLIPDCDCGGKWGCYACGTPLRRKYAPTAPITNVWGTPDVRQYLEAIRDRAAYTPMFPTGDRGGAMLDLGDGNHLEVFLPWQDDRTGDVLPYMPMPLDGCTIIHDPARGRVPKPWEIEACRAGMCACDETATGWKLTRPLIRGLLGVSDSFLADHAGELPGRLPCWCVCVNTVEFVKEALFNPVFKFPTREASRAARAARETARKCRPPRPNGRWRSRPRRK
jgi:hypothetical protein